MDFFYNIHEGFNLPGFLTAMRADGIKLEKTELDPLTNGYIIKTSGRLQVSLYAAGDPDRGLVMLDGNLANYENTIALRVAQYDS